MYDVISAYHQLYSKRIRRIPAIHCAIIIPVIARIFRTYACCNTSRLLLNDDILDVKCDDRTSNHNRKSTGYIYIYI